MVEIITSSAQYNPSEDEKIVKLVHELWRHKKLSNGQMAHVLGMKPLLLRPANWENQIYAAVTQVSIIFPNFYPNYNVVRLPYLKHKLVVTDDPDLITAYGIVPRATNALTKFARLYSESQVIRGSIYSNQLQKDIASEIRVVLRTQEELNQLIGEYRVLLES